MLDPGHFLIADGRPFAFAGLWDVWGTGPSKLLTCCLITTAANELVRPIHDRMPVVLPPERYAGWPDPDADMDALAAMLRPHPPDGMTAAEVGPAVNSPRNDGPECMTPAA